MERPDKPTEQCPEISLGNAFSVISANQQSILDTRSILLLLISSPSTWDTARILFEACLSTKVSLRSRVCRGARVLADFSGYRLSGYPNRERRVQDRVHNL